MRNGSRRFGALLLVAFPPLLLAASVMVPSDDAEPEAWHAAHQWLDLMDNRDYQESWNQAARIFQNAITPEAWAREAAAARERRGDPITRELIDTHPVVEPPGLPPGEYLRIRYECECSAAGTVKESVILLKEADRGWRVAAYTVEP